MTNDPISGYLVEVKAALPGSPAQRKRVLEEIENHLRDAIADYEARGVVSTEAIARVLDDFGPAAQVAAGFTEQVAVAVPVRGARRWLPLAIPAIALLGAAFVIASADARDITHGGFTVGDRIASLSYLRWALIDGALLVGAYIAVRRADRDRAWLYAAWTCSLLVVAIRFVV